MRAESANPHGPMGKENSKQEITGKVCFLPIPSSACPSCSKGYCFNYRDLPC